MTWVYSMPAIAFFFATVIGLSALSAAGLYAFGRLVPQSDEVTHNDVAGPIIGTVGTVLAVILSFLLVSVWQQYDGASATVEQEASAVADLYHLAGELPPTPRAELQGDLRAYVDAVVREEWPAMRRGGRSDAARRAELDAARAVARYQPATPAQQALQQSALNLSQTIQDARRNRLWSNEDGIPNFFWVGNVILAVITIGFCYLFRVRSFVAHLVMTTALTVVIATVFVLIALFDYPFRGDTQIPPAAFVHLQQTLGLIGSD